MLDAMHEDDGEGRCFYGDLADDVLSIISSRRGRCNFIFWDDVPAIHRDENIVLYENEVVGNISIGHQAANFDRVICMSKNLASKNRNIVCLCSDASGQGSGVTHIIHNDKAISFENGLFIDEREVDTIVLQPKLLHTLFESSYKHIDNRKSFIVEDIDIPGNRETTLTSEFPREDRAEELARMRDLAQYIDDCQEAGSPLLC
jgi:hypothetical protein